MTMQNIYVYNRKDKIGKLIWYRGIVPYPYVVTYSHSYNRIFLYSGSVETFYRKEARQMIGDYIKDPSCGLGKVIKLRPGNELVYFFKANDSLHDGAIEPGSCPDNHGWWFGSDDIKRMKYLPPLASLIERRQQWK